MKIIAAIFAVIAVLTATVGFLPDVLPILTTLGRIAAGLALAGFAATALVYTIDELAPSLAFDNNDINP
ncbi:MAG: hypothetical protein ABI583_05630 [Betaproteobacteria bacterium]